MKNKTNVPTTLDEAIEFLIKENQGNPNISGDENEFLCEQHHLTGQYLRNEWGLWMGSPLQTWFKEKGIHHADDMSSIILTSFHRKVNNKEIKLDEQIKKHRKFWAKNRPEVNEGIM